MKIIGKISILSLALVLAASCDFLNVKQLGRNDIPKFFSNVEGLRSANLGLYRLFYNFYNAEYMKYSEVAADMVSLSATATDMRDQYDYTSNPSQETGAVGRIWSDGYELLSNVNHLLYYAPELKTDFPASAEEVDRIMAQALFFRAITHLFICNAYAQPYNYTADASHLGIAVVNTIPLVNDRILRSPIRDVYKQIVDDLNEAIRLFGNSAATDKYTVSALTCKALLARVYLYMEDWGNARDYASEVIQAKSLTPADQYAEMFVQEVASDESVFRLNGDQISSRGLRSFYEAEEQNVMASRKFLQEMDESDENDVRRQLLDGTDLLKYDYGPDYDPTADEEDLFYSPIVLRVSEMYLIRAEAYCRLNEASLAAADLKEIIARAENTETGRVTLPGSADQLLDVVKRQRILELSLEGVRFFDIVRYKENLERDAKTTSVVRRLNYPNDKFVLPLSSIEVEVNIGIQQNPGY